MGYFSFESLGERLADTGTYVGSGGSQDVNIGFQPRIVIVYALDGSALGGSKTPDMTGNNAIKHDGNTTVGIILSLTGFAVDSGLQFNKNGTTFAFIAMR